MWRARLVEGKGRSKGAVFDEWLPEEKLDNVFSGRMFDFLETSF